MGRGTSYFHVILFLMSVIRTKALILRHTTDREHDRMLTILTPSKGQLRVRARGTKKSASKLGGSLEPMMEVDLSLADGRVVDLVTGSIIIYRFPLLRKDIVTMTMAQWYLELVESVTKPDQPAEELYDLIKNDLLQMEKEIGESTGQRWLLLNRRALQIMTHEGFAPRMDACSVCHLPLGEEAASYDAQQGFVHTKEAHVGALSLTDPTVSFLRDGQQPAGDRAVFRQTHELVERLIHHTLDRPLKSERVLRTVVRTTKLPKA